MGRLAELYAREGRIVEARDYSRGPRPSEP
jgi:hypothetical protein